MINGARARLGNYDFGAALGTLIPFTYLIRHIDITLLLKSLKQRNYYKLRLNPMSRLFMLDLSPALSLKREGDFSFRRGRQPLRASPLT